MKVWPIPPRNLPHCGGHFREGCLALHSMSVVDAEKSRRVAVPAREPPLCPPLGELILSPSLLNVLPL